MKDAIVGALLGLTWISLMGLAHGMAGGIPTVRIPRTTRYIAADIFFGCAALLIGLALKLPVLIVAGAFLLGYFTSGKFAMWGQRFRHANQPWRVVAKNWWDDLITSKGGRA